LSHRPRKRFGQNFLHDSAIIHQIIAAVSPTPNDRVVEIGPGRGAITRGLLQAAGRLEVVELDRDLIQPLAEFCTGQGELQIYSADALKFDFCRLVEPDEQLRLVGNLPYNISTPLLFRLLDQAHCIQDMHFMLQKEVVDRMAAEPGSKTYGRLSVTLQARCKVEPLFTISPAAFQPQPKVKSALVRLTPYRPARFMIENPELFERLVGQAFSQRRKTLRNSLRNLLSAKQMEACQIDPSARVEQLAVEDFVRLANVGCKIDPVT
jgi:16S rRNA (adenine1518-N6/adenine1519-N6)-dimethyltransferase